MNSPGDSLGAASARRTRRLQGSGEAARISYRLAMEDACHISIALVEGSTNAGRFDGRNRAVCEVLYVLLNTESCLLSLLKSCLTAVLHARFPHR
jgi:hypothetical protein